MTWTYISTIFSSPSFWAKQVKTVLWTVDMDTIASHILVLLALQKIVRKSYWCHIQRVLLSCLSRLFHIHLSSLLEMLNFCGLDCYLILPSKVISDCSELGSKCSQWHSQLGGGVEFPEQLLYNINPTKSKLFKTRRQCPALPPRPLLEFNIRQFPFEIVCPPTSKRNGNCYSVCFLFYLVLKSFPHRTANMEAPFWNRPTNQSTNRENIVQSAFSKVGK